MYSVLEVAIGFVCACLPSLNLLMEGKATSRQRRIENLNWHCPGNLGAPTASSRLHWLGSSSNHPTAPPICQYSKPGNDNGMIDLDIELALQTGQAVRMRSDGHASVYSLDVRPLSHRLTSDYGRREGWLAMAQNSPRDHRDAAFIRQLVESSKAQTTQGTSDPWCAIWDGPRTNLSSEQHGHTVQQTYRA